MYKIKKSDYKNSEKVRLLYARIAKRCNEIKDLCIEDDGDYYIIKENPLYQPLEGQDLKKELLSAQLDGNIVTEEISPTTYFNVMIKL